MTQKTANVNYQPTKYRKDGTAFKDFIQTDWELIWGWKMDILCWWRWVSLMTVDTSISGRKLKTDKDMIWRDCTLARSISLADRVDARSGEFENYTTHERKCRWATILYWETDILWVIPGVMSNDKSSRHHLSSVVKVVSRVVLLLNSAPVWWRLGSRCLWEPKWNGEWRVWIVKEYIKQIPGP